MPKVYGVVLFLYLASQVPASPVERDGKGMFIFSGLLQQCVDICQNLSKGNTVWMPFYCFLIFPNLPMSCLTRSTSKSHIVPVSPVPCPDDMVACNRTLSTQEIIGEVNTDDGRYQLIKEHLINNRVYIVMKRLVNESVPYDDGDLLQHKFDSIQTLPQSTPNATDADTYDHQTPSPATSESLSPEYFSTENVSTANLSPEYFSTENVSTANLSPEYFSTENVSTANLSPDYFSTENVSTANLSPEYFSTENVSNANLISENFTTENVSNANLTSENFSTENVSNANLISENSTELITNGTIEYDYTM